MGASLKNTRFLVCRHCLDIPQTQLRAIIVPADPTPIIYASVEPYLADESNYASQFPATTDPQTGIPIPNQTKMATMGGQPVTAQPIGIPNGLEQAAIQPLALRGAVPVHFDQPLAVLSVIANGNIVTVTCKVPHNLAQDGQVSVEGLSARGANGFYSVVPTTATAFTYQTYSPVSAFPSPLLTGETNIVTCLVGLPRGYDTIPATPSFPPGP